MKSTSTDDGIRLNKYLASSGICTRRDASAKIKSGQVKVNDQIITFPGHRVKENDKVFLNNKLITPSSSFTYILLNKPKNTLCVSEKIADVKTLATILGNRIQAKVQPVDILDKNDLGLILLTDDPELISKFKSTGHQGKMILHVFLDKEISEEGLQKVHKVMDDDDEIDVSFVKPVQGKGKNEIDLEIRIGALPKLGKIFEQLSFTINKIDRIYFAGLTKKDLPRDRYRHLTVKEVVMLKHFT